MKIYSRFLWLPVVILLLQACSVTNDYRRPEVLPEDNSLYRMDGIPTDTTSMADIPWQELFTDTILQNHIYNALENNLDLRVAMKNIELAQAYLEQGEAAYYPRVNSGLNYSFSNPSDYAQGGNLPQNWLNQYSLTANVSWEADIWGKLKSMERAYEASYFQSIAVHQAIRTEIVASVASLYYQLLTLDEKIKITKASIGERQSSLETTRALKKAGRLTAVAVKQTEAQIYAAQVILVNLKKSRELFSNTLSLLMGEPSHEIRRGNLDAQEITTELKTGVPALLLENRPDVIAAEYELIRQFELSNVAKANFYPQLTLSASAGFQSLALAQWFSASSLFSSVAAGLFQPILNGKSIRTAYQVSLTNKERALLNYKRTLLVAGKEVSDALENYESTVKVIEILKKQYQALNQATEFSEALLNNGLANYLEVLRARQNALNTKLKLTDARYEKLNSIVTLYQALGGGR